MDNDLDRSESTKQAGLGLMGANAFEAYTKALRHPSDFTDDEVILATEEDWLDAKSSVHYALSFPVGVVIWNQMKRSYSREMTEEIDEYMQKHGADRVFRHFEQMLGDIRRLPAVPG